MRTYNFLPSALAALALVMPLTCAAQKFQEPTKEELQMTSDPKAPGAPAVYLYREETTDNRNHYTSVYVRIKVLTELGKEWATVEVPYDSGHSAQPIIEGRTIHSDGTVIPLAGKASDLLVFKEGANHLKAAVFNMPGVEVGSILEYRMTIPHTGGMVLGASDAEEGTIASELASEVPEWQIQKRIFIHKEHFYFNPFSSLDADPNGNQVTYFVDGERASYLLYTPHLPAGAKVSVDPKGDYTLDVQDVPPVSHEQYAMPQASLQYRVRFYYTPYNSAALYWESEQKRWAKSLDQYAGQTAVIKSAAAEFTAALPTPEAKARKLYDVVQSLENTDFTRAKSGAERQQLHLKSAPRNAQDVLNEKSGSGNDLAALYLALARAAGLEVYAMQVANRSWRVFDPNYLTINQLDSLVVILRIDGKDTYLDPGEKLCPFGQLAWQHALAGGLAENSKEPAYTPANLTKDAITAHAANLVVSPSGAVTGTVQILMNGPQALYWRQLNITNDAGEVNKQFNESLHSLLPPGLAGEVEKFQGLDTSQGYLSTIIKVEGQLGSATGKRILLPAFPFSQGARPLFAAEEKREAAIDLHFAEQVIDDVIYHLPPGFSVESVPPPAQLQWPDHAQLVVKTQPAAGTIEVKHTFARFFVLLDPKDYSSLHDYYRKLAAADQQQVVLAAGASSGN